MSMPHGRFIRKLTKVGLGFRAARLYHPAKDASAKTCRDVKCHRPGFQGKGTSDEAETTLGVSPTAMMSIGAVSISACHCIHGRHVTAPVSAKKT